MIFKGVKMFKTFRIVLTITLIFPSIDASVGSSSETSTPEPVKISNDFESSEENSELSNGFEARFGSDDDIENEHGNFFQGDIELQPDQEEVLLSKKNGRVLHTTRIGLLADDYRWPKNNQGQIVVPFTMSARYSEKLPKISSQKLSKLVFRSISKGSNQRRNEGD